LSQCCGVALNTTLQRAALTYAVATAAAASTALRTWLVAKVASSFSAVSGGKVLTSTSSNGTSVGFFVGSQISPFDAVETWQAILDLYDTAAIYKSSSVEATILTEMWALLVPHRECEESFSSVRLYA
jgi:hypothetical protein